MVKIYYNSFILRGINENKGKKILRLIYVNHVYFHQNEEMAPFKEFLSTLKSSLASLHSALVEVNICQLSDELLELNLVELDNEVKNKSYFC